ncbi:MAG: hypothetical protein ABI621_02445 [Chloroflexota bacterium]
MSKKTKKKRQQKKFPWVIVVVVVALATAAIFLSSKPGPDDSGGTPAIAVDDQNIDMGYIKLGEYRTIKIKVTNTGDGVLRFKDAPYLEVVEGCCPPELSVGTMALNPGQSTYVQTPEFMRHAGMDGKHDFSIHLKTNDPKTPELLVHVLSDWGP